MDDVESGLNILYLLERITGDSGHDRVMIDGATIARVKVMLQDFDGKIGRAKSHLRQTQSLLNEITLAQLETSLTNMKQLLSSSVQIVDKIARPDQA
jgi:hypothetical protein